MGGIVLVFLLVFGVLILLTPAMRARAKARREEDAKAAEAAVLRRLDDHRNWRGPKSDDRAERD